MSKSYPIEEVVRLACLASDDILQRNKGKFLKYAPIVWDDLQLKSIKDAKRQLFQVNKRTNTVNLPCAQEYLCSVSVMDRSGIIHPVYRNDRLHDDIVDIAAAKDCFCEKKCASRLCNLIKGYEAIQEVKTEAMPDSSTKDFLCVTRRSYDNNGFFYEERQYPIRIYHNGVWVDVQLKTENKTLCKLELDDKGCVCDNDKNFESICSCTGLNNNPEIVYGGTAQGAGNAKTWVYYCASKYDVFNTQCNRSCHNPFMDIYNISEDGNRLIFPKHFGWDKVLIRWFEDPNLRDLQVPYLALDSFIAGIKWWNVRFNDKMQILEPKYSQTYSNLKFGLLKDLNRYTIKEIAQAIAQKTKVATYIGLREHNWETDIDY